MVRKDFDWNQIVLKTALVAINSIKDWKVYLKFQNPNHAVLGQYPGQFWII